VVEFFFFEGKVSKKVEISKTHWIALKKVTRAVILNTITVFPGHRSRTRPKNTITAGFERRRAEGKRINSGRWQIAT
jgi:hypothetical protein